MPKLVETIDKLYRKGEFTEKPRGPLGSYVQVENEKWKVSIEGIIGSFMHAFYVNDAKDRKILSQLISREFPQQSKFSIITSKFSNKPYDVKKGQVKPVHNTYLAMNMMRVDDPVVLNCLIDNCKIETILLVEDVQLAMKLTSYEENVPRNLLRIVLLNPNSDFYPAPNYRTYANDKKYAKYLQVNMAQRKA